MKNVIRKNTVAIACGALAFSINVAARPIENPEGESIPSQYAASNTNYTVGNSFGGAYTGMNVEIQSSIEMTGYVADKIQGWAQSLVGGNRDMGKWLCDYCIMNPDNSDAEFGLNLAEIASL